MSFSVRSVHWGSELDRTVQTGSNLTQIRPSGLDGVHVCALGFGPLNYEA